MIEELFTIKKQVEQSKVLIFDFDGVIADSVEVKTKAFASMYEPYGMDIVDKVIDHHKNNGGMSRFEKFQYYHRAFLDIEISQEIIDNLSAQFSKLVFDKVVSSSEIDSVTEFIEKYGVDERICVINSATPQLEIEKIIQERGMSKFFSSIFGSPSSKLDNISIILNKYSCRNEDVVFFGDSEADLMTAIQAKINFVGIGSEIRSHIHRMAVEYPCMKDFKLIMKL